MRSHEHGRSRRRMLSPEELAAAYEQALRWREEWRAEVADRKSGADPVLSSLPRPAKRKEKSSAQFATGIARAEFGRFYWKEPAPGATKRKQK